MQHDKGKGVAVKVTGKGKRKADTDKTGGQRKRNRGVVQFFENEAYEVGDDDDDESDEISDFGEWEFFNDKFESQSSKVNNKPGFAQNVPFSSKEEEFNDIELKKWVIERCKPGSNYVTHADDRLITTIPVDENETLPSYKEPTVWKIKCMIGREKQSVFCLMQKFVAFNSLGNKLQIISAFSIEHVKGFIYVEAERQSDLYEACNMVSTVYLSRVTPVPKNEVIRALSVQSNCNEVSLGSWARVKNGRYKGDLAQIISVNDSRKKATVKLIPRIDLQVLAEKYGGGVRSKKGAVPLSRFVTSTELEEFRPLIQCRRDRETGLAFEILDGMMLKDGYLYKKVKIDSLSVYGVLPSEAELFKFVSSTNENSDCEEWLNELYGEKHKEPSVLNSDKEEGSSNSNIETGDLVLFNRKDFGAIVGLEKEEYYKILKEGSEGPETLTVHIRQLKKVSFENRFTSLDKHKKMIIINDMVRVLEGPLEGRQGNVKHIYRGTIFLHNEVEQENSGLFCCKSQICEKIKIPDDASKKKDDESSVPSSDDPRLLPKSPLAPEKPSETRGRNSTFKREAQEGFTIGQSLTIRVGPLKGYLCRCLAICRSNVTVKLDSKQEILTVKSEHLIKARGRSSPTPMRDDKDAKPSNLLGNSEGAAGARTSAGGSERCSQPAFPSSDTPARPKSNSAMHTDNKDEEGGGAKGNKVTPKPSLTWGNSNTTADVKYVVIEKAKGSNWGNKRKPKDQVGPSQNAREIWGSNSNTAPSSDATSTWPKRDYSRNEGPLNLRGKGNEGASKGPNWGNNCGKSVSDDVGQGGYGGKKANNSKDFTSPGWGKTLNDGGGRGGNWGKKVESPNAGQGGGRNERNMINNNNQGGSWGYNNMKRDNTAPPWGKNVETTAAYQSASWGKSNTRKNDGAPVWGKTVKPPDGVQGESFGNSNTKRDNTAPAWGKNVEKPTAMDQGGIWGKSNTIRDNTAPAWGKNVETPTAVDQGGIWGKNNTKNNYGAPTWGTKVVNNVVWNSCGQAQDSQGGGRGSGKGSSWGNKQSEQKEQNPWEKSFNSFNGGRGGGFHEIRGRGGRRGGGRSSERGRGERGGRRGGGRSSERGRGERGGRRGGGRSSERGRGERGRGMSRGGFRGRGGRSCGWGTPKGANQEPGSGGPWGKPAAGNNGGW